MQAAGEHPMHQAVRVRLPSTCPAPAQHLPGHGSSACTQGTQHTARHYWPQEACIELLGLIHTSRSSRADGAQRTNNDSRHCVPQGRQNAVKAVVFAQLRHDKRRQQHQQRSRSSTYTACRRTNQ
jgi:hypothetical protein